MKREISDKGDLRNNMPVAEPTGFINYKQSKESDFQAAMPSGVQMKTTHADTSDNEKGSQTKPEEVIQ